MSDLSHLPPAYAARLAAMTQKAQGKTAADFLPQTNAERQQAFRDRAKAEGRRADTREARSRDRDYDQSRSLFATGEFIAIDGEGVSEGRTLSVVCKAGGAEREFRYRSQRHYMVLLAASSGHTLTTDHGRLRAVDCLDLLLRIAAENPKAILVCFGGSYDVNQMLLYDLPRHALRAIGRGIKTTVGMNGCVYRIEYRARKSLQVWRWDSPKIAVVMNRKGQKVEAKADAHFCLWDTIGFFQAGFREVMAKWLGKDHPDYLMIERMKAMRSEFTRDMMPDMIEYNAAECRALVQVCDKLRDAVGHLGLTLNRWDGAGAIAAAMAKRHDIKQYKGRSPPEVMAAARCAFSGGHIEVCRLGTFNAPIHHYDVNSAYPSVIRHLPRLDAGHWDRGTNFDPPPGFTMVRVRYRFHGKMPFYPLFFRCIDGSIIYPQDGEGWYWYPEFEAAREYAMQHGAQRFDVIEWFHWTPADDTKPFAFIETYYKRRKLMCDKIARGEVGDDEGWIRGGEKVLKLGCNSCYGKLAQQVGSMNGEPPPYFQMEWAGYVTAGCRAQLMHAAIQEPDSIISFATDGIYSLKPLRLDTPKDKVLGAWEYKRHAGMVVAMPGVYWVFEDGETIGETAPTGAFSRGFDRELTKTPDRVLQAWREGKARVDLPSHRLITMGSACATTSDEGGMWRARGRFVDGWRTLDIAGSSVKRMGVSVSKSRLYERHVGTDPRTNWRYVDWICEGEPEGDPRGMSCPYAVSWLDGDDEETGAYDAGLIERLEELDADDSLW